MNKGTTEIQQYPYRVVGEHYQRRIRNKYSIIMVDTIHGCQRDAIPSLLIQLPNFEKLFCKKDREYIFQAIKREENRLLSKSNILPPIRPKKTERPNLHLIINKNFNGYRNRI